MCFFFLLSPPVHRERAPYHPQQEAADDRPPRRQRDRQAPEDDSAAGAAGVGKDQPAPGAGREARQGPQGLGEGHLQRARDERVCPREDRGVHQPARPPHRGDDREGDLAILGAVPRCWH